MQKLILTLMFLCVASAAQATSANTAPPGNIYPVAPFNNASLFTSVPCGKPFACDSSLRDEDLLKVANKCAQKRLGFPDSILTIFSKDAPYENCALPETYAPKGPGLGATAQWPICCLVDRGDDTCVFSCHYYISGSSR